MLPWIPYDKYTCYSWNQIVVYDNLYDFTKLYHDTKANSYAAKAIYPYFTDAVKWIGTYFQCFQGLLIAGIPDDPGQDEHTWSMTLLM